VAKPNLRVVVMMFFSFCDKTQKVFLGKFPFRGNKQGKPGNLWPFDGCPKIL